MGFSRQEYWTGLPCAPPGELPNPESERVSLSLPHWQAGSSPPAPPGKPLRASGWLQRKAENAKNWRKVWDPEGGVVVCI